MATLSLPSFLPFLISLLLLAPPNFVSSQWGNPLRSSPPIGSPEPGAAPGTSSPPNPVSSPQLGNPPRSSPGPAAAPLASSPPNPPQTASPPNPVSSQKCNEHDRATLLKVNQQWGNVQYLDTWLPGTDCCTWDQVQCTQDGRVGRLTFFSFNNIYGQIPAAMGDLTALTDLAFNQVSGLTGPIPSSFAKLTSLVSLGIHFGSINGSIPSFLSRLTNLTFLDLNNNKLTGHIPPGLADLPRLCSLDLSSNELTGTIPPGLVLHLGNPWLSLSNNKLTGGLPKSFGDFYIYYLDLSYNRLDFDLTKVRFPPNIAYVFLNHNRIHGRVPESLNDQQQLVSLDLSYNRLCGEIPTGGALAKFGADRFVHNKCLCGAPLPPCGKPLGK